MISKKTTIAVVDDHRLIRQMWITLFAGDPNFEIIGEAENFDETINMIRAKRPDIVLLDINLDHASGMDAMPLIRKLSPGTRVIAVSMHTQPAYAKKMLQLGAKGYLTKNSSHEEVYKALEIVINGGTYICSEIKDHLAATIMVSEPVMHDTKELSMREIEIITLIKNGLSSKEISSDLHISARTVEVHRHNILRKLKIKNAAALINYINTTDLGFN